VMMFMVVLTLQHVTMLKVLRYLFLVNIQMSVDFVTETVFQRATVTVTETF
jgi:hypothetical protein